MSDRGQRTELPTQRRVQKARSEGRLPASREMAAAVQFLTFALLVAGFAASWCAGFRDTVRYLLRRAFTFDATPAAVSALLHEIASRGVWQLAGAGALLAAAAFGAHLAATQFGFSLKPLAPNFGRLNVANRLRELPRQNIPLFVQALVLLPLFVIAVWGVIRDNLDAIRMMPLGSVEQGANQLAVSIRALIWKAAAVFLAFGAFDYYRQRRRWLADLRMSKQEIREEMRELEVNPHIKGRIRRLQREYARKRMIQQVPEATAVVVNPTHYAVAIRYVVESMSAPVVVAKGRNLLALRIRRIAAEHNVAIVENPPLAQALYKACDVGQEIPAHLYRAVAEILAYVYRLMGRR